jgi:hypothetical protein
MPTAGAASATGGKSSAGAGAGGRAGGASTTGGNGSAGGAGGVVGHGGQAGISGGVGGETICVDGICGLACDYHGVQYFPGDDFSDACNACHCDLTGIATCDAKDCDKDCEYLEGEYEGAYGEAQYCMLNGPVVACDRSASATLDCDCPTPVTSDRFFAGLMQGWANKWKAAGCAKPQSSCPVCLTIGTPHCDDDGVCRYH